MLSTLLILFTLGFAQGTTTQETTVVARSATKDVRLTGFTRARESIDVAAEVSARVETVARDMGDTVGSDGLFIRLDDTFARLELDANQAQQKQLESNIAYLSKEAKRYASLLKQATISPSTFDELNNRYKQAQLEQQILTVQAETTRETIKRHHITLPEGWRIIRRDVAVGSWVNAGSVVGRAGDFSSLIVPFSLDAASYTYVVEHSDEMFLELPDIKGRVKARLLRASPDFDETTRKTAVDLLIEEGMPQWRGGIRTRLILKLPTSHGVVELPEEALIKRYETWWVTRADGKELRVIHQGKSGDGWIRVKSSAVAAGDRFKVLRKDGSTL